MKSMTFKIDVDECEHIVIEFNYVKCLFIVKLLLKIQVLLIRQEIYF